MMPIRNEDAIPYGISACCVEMYAIEMQRLQQQLFPLTAGSSVTSLNFMSMT